MKSYGAISLLVVFGQLASGHLYSNKTGSLYLFHRECRTYAEARQVCQDQGGDLVVIDDEDEAQLLQDLFQENPDHLMQGCIGYRGEIYVGVHVDQHIWQFLDILGNTPSYAEWNVGEPNNLTEHGEVGEQCVTMLRNKKLNDLYCGKRRPFVCELSDYVYKPKSDSIYKVGMASWPEASRVCESQGGHLAVVNSAEEAQEIRTLFDHVSSRRAAHSRVVHNGFYIFQILPTRNVALVGFRYDSQYEEYMTVQGESLKEAGYSTNVTSGGRGDCSRSADADRPYNTCGAIDSSGNLTCVECNKTYYFICEIERKLDQNFKIMSSTKNFTIVRTDFSGIQTDGIPPEYLRNMFSSFNKKH